MANPFGNLETPKWMGPGDDWTKTAGQGSLGRNLLSLLGLRQDKEQFGERMELQKRTLQLDALKTAADISKTATEQEFARIKLGTEIETNEALRPWVENLPPDLEGILNTPNPANLQAAMAAIKFKEGVAHVAGLTADGQEKAAFAKSYIGLDPAGRAAVREYWQHGESPSWMAHQELQVQEQRVTAEEQARKVELFGVQNTARAKTASDLEDQKQRGRIALAEKRVGGGLDPKTKMAFSARMKVAMEEGDFGKADRIIAEFEGGAPHQEEDLSSTANRLAAESQLKDLASQKLTHQREIAKGDKHTGFLNLQSREAAIKEIDEKMKALQEIISGKASAPAGAPSAAPSGPPRLKWNSSTNSLTR